MHVNTRSMSQSKVTLKGAWKKIQNWDRTFHNEKGTVLLVHSEDMPVPANVLNRIFCLSYRKRRDCNKKVDLK